MTILLRVLIVDDSENDALLIARALRIRGYELSFERVDTSEGLHAAVERQVWDIVITDYAMPGFSGMDALAFLKSRWPDTPVIIVSGTIGEEVAVSAMRAGASDYVMKDNLARLVPAVRRELAEATVRRARRLAEEQLRKLSRAVEQSPVSVIITDIQGLIDYVNPRFAQLTGYEAEEVIGKTPSFLKSGETSAAEYSQLWKMISNGKEWNGFFRNRKKNQQLYWVSASISPIYNQENEITHFIAVEEDITELKRNEEERTQLVVRMQRQHATLVHLTTHPSIAEGLLDDALSLISRVAADTLYVDRVNILRFSLDDGNLCCVEAFDRDSGHMQKNEAIQVDAYPRYLSALQAGRVIAAANVKIDTRTRELTQDYWEPNNIAAILDAPIRLHGQVVGLVSHQHVGKMRAWYPDEITFAGQISDLVAQAFLNADLRRRTNELATITRVSQEIMLVPDLQLVFESIARHAAELSSVDASGVFSFHADKRLYVAAGYGVSPEFLTQLEEQGIALGEGAIGRAVVERQAVQIPDVRVVPHYPFADLTTREKIQAALAVPMLRDGEVIGGIVLWQRSVRHFQPQAVAFIQALAQQCVNAVENARLFEAEARRRREAETLRAVTQALSATLDLERVFDLILSELHQVVPYDCASVQQLKGDYMEIIGGHGFERNMNFLGLSIDIVNGHNPNRVVVATRAPVILEDAPGQYQDFLKPPFSQSQVRAWAWLGVPLLFGDRLIGMITLDKWETGFYTDEHARLALAFAAQAAIAIENARLFAEEEHRGTELARALEQQKELDRLKDQFIQNVSHELRTPMAIARGYAEMLSMGGLGELQPQQVDAVNIIVRRMRMLSSLVDDINAILEVQGQAPERELLDLAALVAEILDEFRDSAEKSSLALTSEIEADLPWVFGDAIHLHRVLDNLLGNALKFTPAGGAIDVCLYQKGQFLVLEVADTGIGIAADKLERIFDRFYQVDGSMSRRYGGTGLGLALVKEITVAHNGAVYVESELGQGSVFKVTLPVMKIKKDDA